MPKRAAVAPCAASPATTAASASHPAPNTATPPACRGAWARVTIDQFRRLAFRTFYGHTARLPPPRRPGLEREGGGGGWRGGGGAGAARAHGGGRRGVLELEGGLGRLLGAVGAEAVRPAAWARAVPPSGLSP